MNIRTTTHRLSTKGRWLILCLILVSFLTMAQAGATPKNPVTPLTIGILPDVDSLPLVLAAEEGLFEKAGLQVELVPFKSALERDTAIQTGRLDGGISDILAAAFAQNAGFAVKIVSHTDGRYRLLATSNGSIRHVSELEGKAIGLSPNTIIEYATDMMIRDQGVDPNNVDKMSILDIPLRLQLLLGGQLPAACLPDPLAALAISQGAISIADSEDMDLAPGVLVFTSQALETKSDAIKKVLSVYDIAAGLLNAHSHDLAFLEPLLDKAQFPTGVAQNMELPNYRPAALPPPEEVETVIDWLLEKGLVDSSITFADLTAQGLWKKSD